MAHVGAIGRMNMGPARRSGPPSWVLAGEVFAFGQLPGQNWINGAVRPDADAWSVTRASAIILPDTSGVYGSIATNLLPRTDKGTYGNGGFINKNAAHNFNPTLLTPVGVTVFNAAAVSGVSAGHGGGGSLGLFGVVADAAKVATAGFGDVANGNVFQVDMIGDVLGSAFFVFDVATGNTNPHSWAAWVRNDGADATLRMVGSANYGIVTLVPGAEYSFVKAENWTPDATAKYRPQITFGGVLRMFGMQLLESRFIPEAPIISAGASGTLNTSAILAASGWNTGLASGFAPRFRVVIDRLSDTSRRTIAVFGVDADNAVKLVFDTDNKFKLINRKSAADAVTLGTSAAGSTGTFEITARAKAGDYALDATGLTGATSASSEALPTLTTFRLGSDFSDALPVNGWIEAGGVRAAG